ncbi:hypothetical protein BKK51_12685 [Rodentibacter trehalosifermentans]|uniref:HTH Mu-type domain-containing protein n=1 Tax=Rodentibacter trehalosifermentans TaxID=1908263 RepID=A0A1V3ILF2_9PAST|nr:hypothetical protein BKK51_12685 [Rodentibacter trehalosifermentans]OOF52891.1 hypothetical protein BKK53_02895 [Rodentibacter trehalosifermentans]
MEGIKGISFEFSFNSLPQEVQAELLLKQSAEETLAVSESAPKRKALNYLPEVIWKPFDKATEKQKESAKVKVALL